MELFSQRKGIKPVKNVIQVDSMDEALRNRLWNALYVYYWNRVENDWLPNNPNIYLLVQRLWHSYFKKPIDTLSKVWYETYEEIKVYFFQCPWYEVYDFIEFILHAYPEDTEKDKRVNLLFKEFCNSILEQEKSAYRLVDKKFVQITSEVEISEIEKALDETQPFEAVNTHLKKALDLLVDRKSPDYRNSIKESISAVESICNLIIKEKTTFGDALNKIEKKIRLHLHPALKKAFSNLYGYTCDAGGIRHALHDEENLSFEDAKFMLVSCSAFINYLIEKISKSGIKI